MSIVIEHLHKRYAGQSVVSDVSLRVEEGELFVLLGPSGSGKSTLLKIVAGLTDADTGRVFLDRREVTDLPPAKREVGFVFQSYALFRGMTAAENVEFALKVRGVGKAQRQKRRDELLELVGLSGLGGRLPRQLSGGQQQRVAIARALAHQPSVLLLDEPFGALDAKVRGELRRTLKAIQRELRFTAIFVTHDQEEAFELADRLGVLHFGRLLEVGPPEELYLRPETELVASFLGTANLLVGEVGDDAVRLGPVRFPLSTRDGRGEHRPGAPASERVQVLFRPEDVAVKDSRDALSCPELGEAVVDQRSFVGSFERLRLRLPPLPGVRTIAPAVPFGSREIVIEAARSQHQARRFPLVPGDSAWVGVRRVHALVHPGLQLLILADGSPAAAAALAVGGHLARLSHARATLAGPGGGLEAARERLGAGLAALELRPHAGEAEATIAAEATRQPPDLVILGAAPGTAREAAETALAAAGAGHLLLVPPGEPSRLARLLICVAVGEPGKEDVSFAGRIARHLGAEITVLTVLGPGADSASEAPAQRFLESCARTLVRQGLNPEIRVRQGAVLAEIQAQLKGGRHDGLVLGAPLPGADGELRLTGVVGRLLDALPVPAVIVRSPEAGR